MGILGNIALVIQQTKLGVYGGGHRVPKSSEDRSLSVQGLLRSWLASCFYCLMDEVNCKASPESVWGEGSLPKNTEIEKGITCGHFLKICYTLSQS